MAIECVYFMVTQHVSFITHTHTFFTGREFDFALQFNLLYFTELFQISGGSSFHMRQCCHAQGHNKMDTYI